MMVRFPWPPQAMSANGSQGKWRAKASAAQAYKAACWALCKEARVARLDAPAVEVTVVFCPPRNGRFDLDNLLGRCKNGLDAFADAIGVDDGRWQSMTLERGPKEKGGAVYVHATPTTWQHVGNVAQSLVSRVKTCHENRAGPDALASNPTPGHRRPNEEVTQCR